MKAILNLCGVNLTGIGKIKEQQSSNCIKGVQSHRIIISKLIYTFLYNWGIIYIYIILKLRRDCRKAVQMRSQIRIKPIIEQKRRMHNKDKDINILLGCENGHLLYEKINHKARACPQK